jgi:STE24 endopeptidase
VSRILILLMFVFWLAWRPGYSFPTFLSSGPSLAIFLGAYAVLILGTGIWSRLISARLSTPNFNRSLDRLNRVMFAARIFVPLWFIVGMFLFGWAQAVERVLHHPRIDLTQTLAGVVLGTLPAFIAWAGLWWSQYPAEIAFREQSMVSHLEGDLPVHHPPTFRSYFAANLRVQLLFMVVPVLVISLLHDLFRLGATLAVGSRWDLNNAENPFTWLLAAGVIFLFAPEILRRVLHTEPLPNGPLRRRLEALCRRTGVQYREILLWKTQNNLGNAAVMGFVPRLRYILLSDLLVETMSDEQIEAVFAHELGHVVHKHMVWLLVFFVVLTLFIVGGGAWIEKWLSLAGLKEGPAQGILIAVVYLLKFLLLFGFVSRRFERQADVFAARTMELTRASVPNSSASDILIAARQLSLATGTSGSATALALRTGRGPESGHVGNYGAAVFGSALHRVAVMNNIPVRARSWCHGSIATRTQYLRELSADPARTHRFDRFMLCLYGALVFGLFAGAAFCWAANAVP